MNDRDLKVSLERAEQAYEDLVQTRASLGTVFAETIARNRDLSEFRRHMRDLPLLIRSADIRRTELKVELLARQLKEAEKEHLRKSEAAKKASDVLEQARRAYAQAATVERGTGREVRHLEELRREELGHLEQLRSEEAEQEGEEAEVEES
jgi:hypothetical protein